jgi:hypothetical protein
MSVSIRDDGDREAWVGCMKVSEMENDRKNGRRVDRGSARKTKTKNERLSMDHLARRAEHDGRLLTHLLARTIHIDIPDTNKRTDVWSYKRIGAWSERIDV